MRRGSVDPVVFVILLVGITIMVAATISSFVFGLGDVDKPADDRQQACEDEFGENVTYIGTTDAAYGDSRPLCAALNGTVYAAEGGGQ